MFNDTYLFRKTGSYNSNIKLIKIFVYKNGSQHDKSGIFDLFYGELKTAPMIKDCPLNMECQLVGIVESGLSEIFIGEIVGTYTEEKFLTDGKLDFRKMEPLIL